eukprot:13784348-Heterocapsa_arctica.AAC.1
MADGEIDSSINLRLMGVLLKQLEENDRNRKAKAKEANQEAPHVPPAAKAGANRDASQEAADEGQSSGPA